MEPYVQKTGFKPYIGEGFISPNRQLVTDHVKDLVTEHPSFARAIQKRCLGPAGRLALPITFMSKYLTGSQGQVILEDKDGVVWTIDWIAYMQSGRRLTFTRGWPAFVSRHEIKDGDIFVAEIVAPEHWKVQVICAEVAYTKPYVLRSDHAAEALMDVNSGQSNMEDQEACPDMTSDRKSPLAFLAAENQIIRRKRSGKRKSREDSYPFADSPEKSLRHKDDASPSEKVIALGSDEGSEPSLSDSKLVECIAEKEDDEKLFVYTRKTQTQSCVVSGSGISAVCADMKSFNKGKTYGVRYCQSSKEQCSQYVLHGFQYCILHILEDTSAPYKQCDFVDRQTYARCGFPVCLNIVDTRLCQIHKQHNASTPDTSSLGKDLWSILPKLGSLSLLMMATMVAHQSHNEADFWVLTKMQSSYGNIQIPEAKDGNSKLNLPVEARNICVDKLKSPINICRMGENIANEGVQVLPVKVNEENIVRYVGWKFYAANKGNLAATKSVLPSALENTERLSDIQKSEACRSISVNANNSYTDLKRTSILDMGTMESMQTRSDYAVDEALCLAGQQRTLCAMHIQGKNIGFSRFIGVCKRPWITGAEIHFPQRKHQWVGAFPTKKEEAHTYHDDPDSAVTHFDKREGVDGLYEIGNGPFAKQQLHEIISEAPKKRNFTFDGSIKFDGKKPGRSVPFTLAFDAKHVDTISSQCERPGHSKADEIVNPEQKNGSQCLISMRKEVNLPNSMATDLTLASTCCKEEHYSSLEECRHENGNPFGPFKIQPKIHEGTKESKTFVNQVESMGVVAPAASNVLHAASRTIKVFKKLFLAVPGVEEYESQSDVSVDSLSGPEEPRVTAQLHKRFLDLNDVGHGDSKDSTGRLKVMETMNIL